MVSRRGLALAGMIALLGATRVALADGPTAAQKETARALMDAGHAADDQGDHRTALERFRAADALMHVPTTGFAVARQQAALGMLVEARDTALRVIRLPSAPNEPAPFTKAREGAQAMADQLAARIPSLRISITDAEKYATAQVAVDGVDIPLAALAAPYKVNPGHHVVSAVDGSAGAQREIDVAEGSETKVELSMTASANAGAAAHDAEGQQGEPDQPAGEQRASTPAAVIVLRWGGLGLAVAGVGVGTVTGIMSMSSTKAARANCQDGQCPPSTFGDLHDARTTATISDVGFVVGGVGVVALVTSFLIGTPKDPPPPSTAGVRVEPWVGVRSAGIAGAF
jgi:hypothetical protein